MSIQGSTGSRPPKTNITGYKQHQVQNFTPEQMQIFQQIFGGLQGGLGGGLDYLSKLAGGDEEAFGQMEAPQYSSFNKLLGQIGSRFGDIGAVGSSAFQNATSGAASDFAQGLGAQRHNVQQSAIDKLLGLSQNFLGQRPYDTFLEKNKSGWDTAGDITGMLAKILPFFL